MLEINKEFPDFELKNQDGDVRTLKSYKDKWLVVFFYSKNNTSACTSEVKDFGEYEKEFRALGANIVGVSRDTTSSHKNFIEKLGIKYELLSDPERAFIDKCGLLIDKKMYGKPVKGVNRTTVIVDKNGIIKEIWSKVKVDNHATIVLEALKKHI